MGVSTQGYHGDSKIVYVSNGYGDGAGERGKPTVVLSIVKNARADTACYMDREQTQELIDSLQRAYDERFKVTTLPKADAYLMENGNYIAELSWNPGHYSGNSESIEKLFEFIDGDWRDRRLEGLPLSHWAEWYGKTFVPVYLTEREVTTTVTDEIEGDAVTLD